MRSLSLLFPSLLLIAPGSGAEKVAVDKTPYSLANPTPETLLREMTTDRPDVTESPFTVDAGHTQLEMDFGSYARDRQDGVRTTDLAAASFNVRVGLRHDFELGVFFDPYMRHTERVGAGATTNVRGIGDTTLRAKLNLWGNDGGEVAFGLIGDVKLPTAARGLGNDKAEWTLIVPLAVELGGGWDLGVETSVSAAYNGSGYRAVWLNTVTVGHDLAEGVGAYGELTSQTGDGAHQCTFDTGVAWHLNRNLQLDAGVNIGVSRTAPDVLWFTGISRRF